MARLLLHRNRALRPLWRAGFARGHRMSTHTCCGAREVSEPSLEPLPLIDVDCAAACQALPLLWWAARVKDPRAEPAMDPMCDPATERETTEVALWMMNPVSLGERTRMISPAAAAEEGRVSACQPRACAARYAGHELCSAERPRRRRMARSPGLVSALAGEAAGQEP